MLKMVICGLLFLSIHLNSALAEKWEILRGISTFEETEQFISKYQYTKGDTLYCYMNTQVVKLAVYKNMKWYVEDTESILLNHKDQKLREILALPGASKEVITVDRLGQIWLLCRQGTSYCYMIKISGENVKIYDTYFEPNTNKNVGVNNYYDVVFDNFGKPYLMGKSLKQSYEELNKLYLLKVENDSLVLVKKWEFNESYKDPLVPKLSFDSKNNFWFSYRTDLYYFENDTVAFMVSTKRESDDLPKDSLHTIEDGNFTDLLIDSKDNLTAITSTYGIFDYKSIENKWLLDTAFNIYVSSFSYTMDKRHLSGNALVDTKGNLWIAAFGLPFLLKRDTNRVWTYHYIPSINSGRYFSFNNVSEIKFINDDKIWLIESRTINYDSYIYTIED